VIEKFKQDLEEYRYEVEEKVARLGAVKAWASLMIAWLEGELETLKIHAWGGEKLDEKAAYFRGYEAAINKIREVIPDAE
jgi:hypothetical protein